MPRFEPSMPPLEQHVEVTVTASAQKRLADVVKNYDGRTASTLGEFLKGLSLAGQLKDIKIPAVRAVRQDGTTVDMPEPVLGALAGMCEAEETLGVLTGKLGSVRLPEGMNDPNSKKEQTLIIWGAAKKELDDLRSDRMKEDAALGDTYLQMAKERGEKDEFLEGRGETYGTFREKKAELASEQLSRLKDKLADVASRFDAIANLEW